MHKYPEDFYGAQLSVCVAGYIREEMKLDSMGRFLESPDVCSHYGGRFGCV